MDAMDNLYSVQAALAAAQTTQTGAAAEAQAADTTFSDLLKSLAGSGNSAQEYLFAGLLDGSITVSDSNKLVSALLGTMDSDSGLDGLSSIDTSLLSQDTISALTDLNQSMEQEWLEKLMETLSAQGEEGAESASSDYYKAQAALAEVQKRVLTD